MGYIMGKQFGLGGVDAHSHLMWRFIVLRLPLSTRIV